MIKRISPRCDRQYTFYDTNGEFSVYPLSMNSKWEIVFWNVNTKNSVNYSLTEFEDFYLNCLVREKEITPGFLRDKQFRNSETFYAVARGRLDFFITHKKAFAAPAYWDYEGALYGEFDNFGDALDFLRESDNRCPESARFVETSLTDNEMQIVQYYRRLSKAKKKSFRDRLFF